MQQLPVISTILGLQTQTPAPGALTSAERTELGFGGITYEYDNGTNAIGRLLQKQNKVPELLAHLGP